MIEFRAPAWRSGLPRRHVKEQCLATLIDQHINVSEHANLAHERLHVDLRNFSSVVLWSAKADKPASKSLLNAPPVQMSNSSTHKRGHDPGGRFSSGLATSIVSFMNAWLSFLKLQPGLDHGSRNDFRRDRKTAVEVLRLEFFRPTLERQHHHLALFVFLLLHPPMRRRCSVNDSVGWYVNGFGTVSCTVAR